MNGVVQNNKQPDVVYLVLPNPKRWRAPLALCATAAYTVVKPITLAQSLQHRHRQCTVEADVLVYVAVLLLLVKWHYRVSLEKKTTIGFH